MKTPDQIKKALECCSNAGQCNVCPYIYECVPQMAKDARELIDLLEAQLDRYTE